MYESCLASWNKSDENHNPNCTVAYSTQQQRRWVPGEKHRPDQTQNIVLSWFAKFLTFCGAIFAIARSYRLGAEPRETMWVKLSLGAEIRAARVQDAVTSTCGNSGRRDFDRWTHTFFWAKDCASVSAIFLGSWIGLLRHRESRAPVFLQNVVVIMGHVWV
jgi:hypothetical protein